MTESGPANSGGTFAPFLNELRRLTGDENEAALRQMVESLANLALRSRNVQMEAEMQAPEEVKYSQTFTDAQGRCYIGGSLVSRFVYEAWQKAWALCDKDGMENTPEIVELRQALLDGDWPQRRLEREAAE